MSEIKLYDYMSRIADVLVRMDDDNSLSTLIKQKDDIFEISEHLKTLPMYVDSSAPREEYEKQIIATIHTVKARLEYVWHDFLHKVNTAPTDLHTKGVVILLVPFLEKYIKQYGQPNE